MIAVVGLETVAGFFVERMLNATVEGIGIVLVAGLLLWVVGKRNSGTRFAVWLSVLGAIAVLPLVDHFGASHAGVTRQAQISLSPSWALYLLGLWFFIAAIGLVRVGVGLGHLFKLKKKCTPVDTAALDPLLQSTLAETGEQRHVTLCISDSVRMPTAMGFFKPLVVIPSWALKELSTLELNSVLMHELAHLRRWDDYTNLAQKILGALFFFHPAVWWIEDRLALEREMACDDLVLARTESPQAYAACLVALAEKGFLRRGLALAQAAVSRMHHTSLRVTQILDRDRPPATRVWTPALALVAGFAISAAVVAPHFPRLISFANPEPATEAWQTVSGDGADFYRLNAVPAKLTTTPLEKTPYSPPLPQASAKHLPQPTPVVERRTQDDGSARTATRSRAAALHPATVFVVMRARQMDGPGAVVWTVSVWKVTWTIPEHKKLHAGVLARTT